MLSSTHFQVAFLQAWSSSWIPHRHQRSRWCCSPSCRIPPVLTLAALLHGWKKGHWGLSAWNCPCLSCIGRECTLSKPRIYQMPFRRKDGFQSRSCFHECDEVAFLSQWFPIYLGLREHTPYAIGGDELTKYRVLMRRRRIRMTSQVSWQCIAGQEFDLS